MPNFLKLLLIALACDFGGMLLLGTGIPLLMILGMLTILIGAFLSLVAIFVLLGAATTVEKNSQRRCPACQSRHYLVYPRGSKFGFAFPIRFVKLARSDFRCQECGTEWTLVEIDKRYDSE